MKKQIPALKKAEKEAGPVTVLPKTLPGKLVTPLFTACGFIPSAAYVIGVLSNNFYLPSWLEDLSFPVSFDLAVGIGGKSALRTLAAVAHIALAHLGVGSTLRALGPHFHSVGVSGVCFDVEVYCWVLRTGAVPRRGGSQADWCSHR